MINNLTFKFLFKNKIKFQIKFYYRSFRNNPPSNYSTREKYIKRDFKKK